MMSELTLAYSTCPNDTFIFHALVHGLVGDEHLCFDVALEDVETLNQAARQGRFALSKLSYAAIGHLQERYALLRSGGALGRGCGPLIVARPGTTLDGMAAATVAVPGVWTTARLLLGLYLDRDSAVEPMVFDQIMPAVRDGRYDYGLIIHEGRFTYGEYGLVSLLDLGEWWEGETSLPIPLGGIAARRDLAPGLMHRVEELIRASVEFAFAHPERSMDYIRRHAQEMDDRVIRQHIDLYVNTFSIDLGDEGREAVDELFSRSRRRNLLPEVEFPLLAGE